MISINAITRANSVLEAVQKLLSSLPVATKPWTPDLTRTGVSAAAAKVNVLGLWLERPQRLDVRLAGRPAPSLPLTVTELFEEAERPLLTVVPSGVARDDPRGRTMAGQLLHPPIDDLDTALRTADTAALRSQCLDDKCVRLLLAGQWKEFLGYRERWVADVIRRNVDDHAEWGAKDRRAAAELLNGVNHVT